MTELSHNPIEHHPARWQSTVKLLIAMPIFLGLLLFVPAGSIGWRRGWLFLVVFEAAMAVSVLYLRRVNPEIFFARSRIHVGTKGWDRIVLAFLLPMVAVIFPVAALDDGRYGWSAMSWWFVGLGYLSMIAGIAGFVWAQSVNRFFEPGVRIQTDRGHRVVDSGPYALIRHPGYFAGFWLFVGVALSLGSWWALVPVAIVSLIIVMRIVWEDRMLQAELPGYAAYAQRVRYRLIPGVW